MEIPWISLTKRQVFASSGDTPLRAALHLSQIVPIDGDEHAQSVIVH